MPVIPQRETAALPVIVVPPNGWPALIAVIKDLGFPIAVAVYLLFRLDGLIRENTAALVALQHAVNLLNVGAR